MPAYKLYYFESRGAAELARLILKQAGQDFEDIRLAGEKWLEKKPEMPLKAMPVLEIDGKKICQSMAIVRYLGREFGLMGSSNMEALAIEELLEVFTEITTRHVMKIYFEQDQQKKVELMKEFKETAMPPYITFIETRLKENNDGKGFYVGDKVTVADLALYNTMFSYTHWMGKEGQDPFEGSTLLKALYKRVASLPKIAAWEKVRPETNM
ncbi:SCR11-like protein [Mya arenaria]|uniref:SCR11-like protein n=1 Tax=Mya arenaria TaxID=6604 RepID=A0ABY7FWA4_MYAAR|nr:S-crystallin SL11-like [Mya arenaria]WAR25559.1 SCR11-like protein [Mya arenaria]